MLWWVFGSHVFLVYVWKWRYILFLLVLSFCIVSYLFVLLLWLCEYIFCKPSRELTCPLGLWGLKGLLHLLSAIVSSTKVAFWFFLCLLLFVLAWGRAKLKCGEFDMFVFTLFECYCFHRFFSIIVCKRIIWTPFLLFLI